MGNIRGSGTFEDDFIEDALAEGVDVMADLILLNDTKEWFS